MTDETMAQEAPVEAEEAPQIEVQVEPEETTEPVEQPEAEAEEPEAPKSNGKIDDWIDFDALPDEQRAKVESRIRALSTQVKKTWEVNDQLVKDLRSVNEKVNNWEAGQNAQRVQGEMARLKTDWQEAFDSGDGAKAFDIAQQMLILQNQTTAPQQPEQRQQPSAQDAGVLPEDEVKAINTWASKRAYLADQQEHTWAQGELESLYRDPEWDWQPINEKLREVDRRYKAKTQPKQADVLTSAPDQASRSRKQPAWQKLSDAEKAVAVRLFPELKKEDALKAYAEGKD